MELIQLYLAKRRQFKVMKMFAHLRMLAQPVQLQSKFATFRNINLLKYVFSDLKCKDPLLSLKDLTGGQELEVKPADNTTYADMGNRTQDCELNMVGKPVFHNHMDMLHGAWLRDPIQKDNITNQKVWLTKETETSHLYEYETRNDYRKDKRTRPHPYKLTCPFKVKII